jgi:hypothetical protein
MHGAGFDGGVYDCDGPQPRREPPKAIQFPPWHDDYSTDDIPRRFIEAFVNARELEAWGFRRVVAAAHGHPSSHLGALLTHSLDSDLARRRHGEYRAGAYQELARGFGVKEYKPLLSSGKANQTRLKTASELGSRLLGEGGFSASLVRNDDAQTGKNWLRNEVRDYWNQRKNLIAILRYLATMGIKTLHRGNDAEAAGRQIPVGRRL